MIDWSSHKSQSRRSIGGEGLSNSVHLLITQIIPSIPWRWWSVVERSPVSGAPIWVKYQQTNVTWFVICSCVSSICAQRGRFSSSSPCSYSLSYWTCAAEGIFSSYRLSPIETLRRFWILTQSSSFSLLLVNTRVCSAIRIVMEIIFRTHNNLQREGRFI